MKTDFYESLQYALERMKMQSDFPSLIECIGNIKAYEDIKTINESSEHILYPWVPVLVFQLFGYDMYQNCDLNQEATVTYIMFRPNIKTDFSAINTIKAELDCRVKKYAYQFTPDLIARLYGGFPWFQSYCKICNQLALWNEVGTAYKIESNHAEGIVRKLVAFKNKYREIHSEETVQIEFPDEEYDGIIHSFHCPNCIENSRHCEAIEMKILGEEDE